MKIGCNLCANGMARLKSNSKVHLMARDILIGLYSETGLISETSLGATIQNLVIEKAVVIQPSTISGFDGPGAIGMDIKGDVKNCVVKNSIIRSERFGYVGAIAGTGNQATISDCQVINCSISSNTDAGGIVGNGGTIVNCSVDENTVVIGDTTGGIAASANIITNCNNAASVTGTTTASGIVGILTSGDGSIEDCNNTGDVTSTGSLAGGVIGNINSHHLSISNCTNSGNIKAETANTDNGGAGGIAGVITTSVTIENCSSTGIIEGKTNVGSIVGNSKIIMGNTYES